MFGFILRGSRSKLFLLPLIMFSCSPVFIKAQKTVVNVLTYNIRLATPDDAPNTWDNRKENVFTLVKDADADIFGLQEALYKQVADFEKAFPGFARLGVGRDDGKTAGEFSPIFYNAKKFSLMASSTFWLSQTPSVAGSRGWDAACNRVVTWAQLKDRKSQAMFVVFCTHFDHMGVEARRNSARLILRAVDSLAAYKPAVILGDFNAQPDSEPYNLITDFSDRHHLVDARLICPTVAGPEYTFTGFKVGAQPGTRIDYIFLKNNVQVLSYNVNQANNGQFYPSDHLPVSATLRFY